MIQSCGLFDTTIPSSISTKYHQDSGARIGYCLSLISILGADHANTVLAAGRADLAAMARPHLHDAYLTLHAAERYQYWRQPWPGQYLLGKRRPRRPKRRRE